MTTDTIGEILVQIDELISKREKKLKILDCDYVNSDGKILSSDYNDYKQRKEEIVTKANKSLLDLFSLLKDEVDTIRKLQPALIDLKTENINLKKRIPRKIALGKKRITILGKEYYIPNMLEFPFKNNMYMTNKKDVEYLQKIYLRLLYALPFEKIQFYIYDSVGLGKSIENFNILMDNEKIFPNKEVIIDTRELDEMLDSTLNYIKDLRRNKFKENQRNWEEYNRFLYSKGDYNKILPYKICIFIDVPGEMNQEQFRKFKTILNNSYDCGILVLYSFNEIILEADDTKLQRMALELKECIRLSMPLHRVLNEERRENYINFKIENCGEKMPTKEKLNCLLKEYNKLSEKNVIQNNMDLIANINNRFIENTIDKIQIPIGFYDQNGEICEMELSDDIVHYLIGGATGSGKSTFLHDMILSAANKYSPEELKLYLLDFKEAVEFNTYATPEILPHAALVATEADINYGLSVLDHLNQEIKNRGAIFKKAGVNDIKSYRKKDSENKMHRIILVIDEFQVLLQSSKSMDALEKLRFIAKQGRSNGIHMVLCTQTLKGIDFNEILSQIEGRIVLKSTPEDSKSLFGSSDNNEEAAKIDKPFAIINVKRGYKEYNKKFKVAWHENKISEKIRELSFFVKNKEIKVENKVYNGERNPEFPNFSTIIDPKNLNLVLGITNNYEQSYFKLEIENEKSKNIAIIGNNKKIRNSMIVSILSSIEEYNNINKSNKYEIIYIGENDLEDILSTNINIINFSDIDNKEGIINSLEKENKKIVIFDDVNCSEIFPRYCSGRENENIVKIRKLFTDLYKNNGCIIAFYTKYSNFKDYQNAELYEKVIGYNLNENDLMGLIDNPIKALKTPIYINNREFILSFKQFMEEEND